MIIYKITNRINGKVYVGLTTTTLEGIAMCDTVRLVIDIYISLCANMVLKILL